MNLDLMINAYPASLVLFVDDAKPAFLRVKDVFLEAAELDYAWSDE